jgi:CubicO group peptidase (beta-lactamase class C family)
MILKLTIGIRTKPSLTVIVVSSVLLICGCSAQKEPVRTALSGYIDRGEVPGLVFLVSHHGKVRVEAIGKKGFGQNEAMKRDCVFRIASMTKPIVAVATMILVEDGKLELDEPVERLMPELSRLKVLKRLDGLLQETVPAKRPITVRDLLTFRAGHGLLFFEPGGNFEQFPIQKAIRTLGLENGPPLPRLKYKPDEWMRRFGTLPLMHQPGEEWMYHTAYEILGVLIARASGQPLETFLQKRIFEPLGMKDTGFTISPENLSRLAPQYGLDPKTGQRSQIDGVEDSQWKHAPLFPSGGGGLASTIDDYLAFAHMLLNKGEYNGKRILSRSSIELMTTDQISAEQRAKSQFHFFPNFWNHYGWGFGVSVLTKPHEGAQPGRYGWDGGYGTTWFNDSHDALTGILMTQVSVNFKMFDDFRKAVYETVSR